VEVHVEDGRIEKIEEDKAVPMPAAQSLSRAVKSCPRARAVKEYFYHPERLNYPLKRAGEKGEAKWEKVSWEQAFDEIAGKLKQLREKYGAEILAFTRGTNRGPTEFCARFFYLFGSPNIIGGSGNICHRPAEVVSCALVGAPAGGMHNPHVPGKTICILINGLNPAQATTRDWFGILDATKAGAKLIVIDPRRTEPAERADKHLQLRPGTDTALLMSMIDVIIREELYDKDFVSRWCHGFDKLRERAREYPPEKAEEISGVPAEDIIEAARMYATNKPAGCSFGMGVEHLTNAVQDMHAMFILPAITGNYDIEGGQFISGFGPLHPSEIDMEKQDALSPQQKEKMLRDPNQMFSWNAYELIQENVKRVWGTKLTAQPHAHAHGPVVFRAMLTGKPYPVRAAITLADNPVITYPNVKLVYRALKSLDLYVVTDFFMTPSAELADYVLPAATWLERPSLGMGVGEAALSPVVEGEYDRKTDYDFWSGLGIRLGQEEFWPWKDMEETYNYRLSSLGYNTLKELMEKTGGITEVKREEKKYEQKGFGTPTGKVELYSTIWEKLGLDPLPYYKEPDESPISNPELITEYPFILTTGGRFLPMYHSEWRQVESTRRAHPDPITQIHPETASELGIKDGDWVWIESPRGRVRQKCQYFTGIKPGVIHSEHGWWFPELPGEEPWLHGMWESNINVVTDDEPENCNDIGGEWPLRALICKVYKAKTYD